MKTFYKGPAPDEKYIQISCPICAESRVVQLWDLGGYSFQRCIGCGHIYQNPRPKADDLARRYDAEYRDYEIKNAYKFFDLMRLGLEDVGFSQLEASLPAEKRFLDVGCATGMLVACMRDRGWSSEGVEVCEAAARYGAEKRSITIHTGSLETVSFPDDSFDMVHSSHVIEHVSDPNVFLTETFRILKPGGWCLCATPNTASFQARFYGKAWRSAIADHVHLFSLSLLTLLFEQTGFTVLRHKTWGGLAQGIAPVPIKHCFDRAAKWLGFGDVMIILAQKGSLHD